MAVDVYSGSMIIREFLFFHCSPPKNIYIYIYLKILLWAMLSRKSFQAVLAPKGGGSRDLKY